MPIVYVRQARAILIACALMSCGSATTPGPARTSSIKPAAAGVPSNTDPESIESKYARFMELETQRLEAKIVVWGTTNFKTQADAYVAMMAFTPVGDRTREGWLESLAKAGLSPSILVEFGKLDPTVVAHAGEQLGERLKFKMAEFSEQQVRIDRLPLGDMDAAEREVGKMLRGSIERSGQSTGAKAVVLPTWTHVSRAPGLIARLETAVQSKAPIVLYFRASWAAPGRRLESEVLNAKAVLSRLAKHERIVVDVSAASDEMLAMQDAMDARTIPEMLIFEDASSLLELLTGTGDKPSPTFRLGSFFNGDAADLVRALPQ